MTTITSSEAAMPPSGDAAAVTFLKLMYPDGLWTLDRSPIAQRRTELANEIPTNVWQLYSLVNTGCTPDRPDPWTIDFYCSHLGIRRELPLLLFGYGPWVRERRSKTGERLKTHHGGFPPLDIFGDEAPI